MTVVERILSVLVDAPLSREEICKQTGLNYHNLTDVLLGLLMDGLVTETRDGKLRGRSRFHVHNLPMVKINEKS